MTFCDDRLNRCLAVNPTAGPEEAHELKKNKKRDMTGPGEVLHLTVANDRVEPTNKSRKHVDS